ncbi:uncharacterized protein [Aristolochia californica]|uniref:uncharacterized protein n=1 Tax=Aristolochia californica TaxID=171875 RepID=UPI0035D91791
MWGIGDTLSHMRGLWWISRRSELFTSGRSHSRVLNYGATKLFVALKAAPASAPVLQLSNFNKLFVVECDASGAGIGVILQQLGHPIAYFSRQLAVEYRAGRLNKVADAMSWCFEDQQSVYSISQPRFLIVDLVRNAHATDPALIRADFYWQAMKPSIATYVGDCQVCQYNKAEHLSPAGLLQPLALPNQVWADISMDFVEGLPLSSDKSVLFVVVDIFSKYIHFIPLAHPYIVTRFSSAYHPQIDKQTEVVNNTIEMYLRCLVGDRPRKLFQWLSWAKNCYNTSFHSALQATPFWVIYGLDPPRLLSYNLGSTNVDVIDQAHMDRDLLLQNMTKRLLRPKLG